MDAPSTSLERHERGIPALCTGIHVVSAGGLPVIGAIMGA